MIDYIDYFKQKSDRSTYPGFEQHPTVRPTSSIGDRLQYAHYSDNRFAKEQVVYDGCSGKAEFKRLSWEYSDRMQQWDYAKFDAACEYAKSLGTGGRTAGQWAAIVEHYHDGQYELKAIATGFNLSNGYDYFVLGLLKKESKDDAKD